MKCQNGNNLKLLHLNKGNSTITTKLSLIKNLVTETKPDLILLNESQADINCTDHKNLIPGFNFEHSEACYNSINSKISRVSLEIKTTLNYIRLKDLENPNNHIIIIKVKINKGKDVIIISTYRQWSISDHHNFVNSRKLIVKKTRFNPSLNLSARTSTSMF